MVARAAYTVSPAHVAAVMAGHGKARQGGHGVARLGAARRGLAWRSGHG